MGGPGERLMEYGGYLSVCLGGLSVPLRRLFVEKIGYRNYNRFLQDTVSKVCASRSKSSVVCNMCLC